MPSPHPVSQHISWTEFHTAKQLAPSSFLCRDSTENIHKLRPISAMDYLYETRETRRPISPKQTFAADNTVDVGHNSGQIQGSRLNSNLYNFFWIWLLMIATAFWLAFTIYFAYNCTLQNPPSPKLVFSDPSNTLLILNILSHGALQLLRESTSFVFEAVRWALASTSSGIPAFTFLGLSRATGPFGVVKLFLGGMSIPGGKGGHRFWTGQR